MKYLGQSPNNHQSGELYFKKVTRDLYEKFHLKFLKWCLSVHHKAANIGCWGDTGRYPLFIDALKLCTDYFHRAKNTKENTLLHEAFVEQQSLNLEWFRNMNSVRNAYNSGKSKLSSINVREHMRILFSKYWNDIKCSSPKLEFYNTLKKQFGFEQYLLLSNHKHRRALTRPRISAHNLYFETGRYARPPIPREDRFCMYCKNKYNLTITESELHVISDCPLYQCAQPEHLENTTDTIDTIHKPFINEGKNTENDIVAGKMAFTIQEIHKAFTDYYTSSQHAHNSTGNCVVM